MGLPWRRAFPSDASDDRGDDRGDDRNTRADTDADTDRNSDLSEREPARGETDEAACKAEDGDDFAARAFEEIGELREGRGEGRVGARVGGARRQCCDGKRYCKGHGPPELRGVLIDGAGTPGEGERLHMELHLEG